MLLITAATAFELKPFLSYPLPRGRCTTLVTGIGPVETAMHLSKYLTAQKEPLSGVLNIGVAGGYLDCEGYSPVKLLDICLADSEVLGDLGICYEHEVQPLRGKQLPVFDRFPLDNALLAATEKVLQQLAVPYTCGGFVTVNGASGTKKRGATLQHTFQAICETMEGAAVARVCNYFSLPLLELRCISNMVDDRHKQQWRLQEACLRCGTIAAQVVESLTHE